MILSYDENALENQQALCPLNNVLPVYENNTEHSSEIMILWD
jgi:hypothetical protein